MLEILMALATRGQGAEHDFEFGPAPIDYGKLGLKALLLCRGHC
jgi:hypothetical protein